MCVLVFESTLLFSCACLSVSAYTSAVEDERAKLFEGSSDADKPRMRSTQEILTKYKFGGVIPPTF